MKIGIVGLGLIGGSFALATRNRTEHQVFGFDTNENTMQKALAEGAITDVLTETNLPGMDLVLLAVMPSAAAEYVARHADKIRGVVMDVCGIKQAVSEKILPLSIQYGFVYVGGHPMAGRESGGYENATPSLFEGASMILVPHPEIPAFLHGYIRALGFTTERISTDEHHDAMIAFTSQMAHVVSNNYCKSETGLEHHGYSADSLRDLTRVGGLNARMWSELFIGNKKFLLKEVDRLLEDMQEMREAIAREDAVKLERLLEEGTRAKYRLFPRGVTCDAYPS